MGDEVEAVAAVERAMVEIRRLQQRRTLARVSEQRGGDRVDPSLTAVVDAIEQKPAHATVSTVATALGVDQPRASRLVARAVEAGLVTRTADQLDGRRALLTLTKRGAEHASRAHRFRQAMFADAMADWTPRQITAFARLLTRFVDSYSRLTAPTAGAGSRPRRAD
jgi:DNA-binding MarR family transcriptional regulator